MNSYSLAPEAMRDLDDIWNFIAADNPAAADLQIDTFLKAFKELARWPGKGHTRRDLTSRTVRFWRVGSYLVIYREATLPLDCSRRTRRSSTYRREVSKSCRRRGSGRRWYEY